MVSIEIIPESIKLVKMTDDEYFSPDYSDYISNSKLGLINPDEGGSIEKYNEGFKGGYSDSFELGSAVHAMVLQPDLYAISNIQKPSGKLGCFAEAVYKLRSEGLPIIKAIEKASIDADYYAGKLSPKRMKTAISQSLEFYKQRIHFKEDLEKKTLFLSKGMATKFESCMLGVKNNPNFAKTLYPKGIFEDAEVFNEYAILCEVDVVDEETGEVKTVKVKAKLDNFTIDREKQEITLNDLKTSGKPVGFFMGNKGTTTTEEGEIVPIWYDGSFQKFHYYRQMAMYSWLMISAVKHLYNINYKLKANILVVETIPNFSSKVYPINGKHIKQGLDEFKKLLILAVNG